MLIRAPANACIAALLCARAASMPRWRSRRPRRRSAQRAHRSGQVLAGAQARRSRGAGVAESAAHQSEAARCALRHGHGARRPQGRQRRAAVSRAVASGRAELSEHRRTRPASRRNQLARSDRERRAASRAKRTKRVGGAGIPARDRRQARDARTSAGVLPGARRHAARLGRSAARPRTTGARQSRRAALSARLRAASDVSRYDAARRHRAAREARGRQLGRRGCEKELAAGAAVARRARLGCAALSGVSASLARRRRRQGALRFDGAAGQVAPANARKPTPPSMRAGAPSRKVSPRSIAAIS